MHRLDHRLSLSPSAIDSTIEDSEKYFFLALDKHGPGIVISDHEGLGILIEEIRELEQAVISGDEKAISLEIHDVINSCFLWEASIRTAQAFKLEGEKNV